MSAKVDVKKCTGCGTCVGMCPVQAIEIQKEKAIIRDNCVECGICINECPKEALSMSGR